MHILLWHRYTWARGPISSGTYMYTAYKAISVYFPGVFCRYFFLIFDSCEVLICFIVNGRKPLRGRRDPKRLQSGYLRNGIFLWFMKIDVWADSIRTTVSSARVLAPVKLEGFWAWKRCRKSISGCFRTFEKRWVIRCVIRKWDCCITLFGILSRPSAQRILLIELVLPLFSTVFVEERCS